MLPYITPSCLMEMTVVRLVGVHFIRGMTVNYSVILKCSVVHMQRDTVHWTVAYLGAKTNWMLSFSHSGCQRQARTFWEFCLSRQRNTVDRSGDFGIGWGLGPASALD